MLATSVSSCLISHAFILLFSLLIFVLLLAIPTVSIKKFNLKGGEISSGVAKFQLWWGGGVENECPHETQVANELAAASGLPALDHNPLAIEQERLLQDAQGLEASALRGDLAAGPSQLGNQIAQVPAGNAAVSDDLLGKEQLELLHEADIIGRRVMEGEVV